MSDDKGTESIPESQKPYDGGQAFPTPEDNTYRHVDGMSLRDYFAAQAIGPYIALLAKEHEQNVELRNGIETEDGPFNTDSHEFHDNVAFAAYAIADAVIAMKPQLSTRDE